MIDYVDILKQYGLKESDFDATLIKTEFSTRKRANTTIIRLQEKTKKDPNETDLRELNRQKNILEKANKRINDIVFEWLTENGYTEEKSPITPPTPPIEPPTPPIEPPTPPIEPPTPPIEPKPKRKFRLFQFFKQQDEE